MEDSTDAIAPDRPALVQRFDGHIALANSLTLKLAGINRDTPDPQGGEIVKDKKSGEHSGLLRDKAIGREKLSMKTVMFELLSGFIVF